MKNVILLATMLITMAGFCMSCAHTRPIEDATPRCTLKKYDTCSPPSEQYFIEHFGAKVFRHKNCMGVQDLLVIVWVAPKTESGLVGAKFLALVYAEKLSRDSSTDTYAVLPKGAEGFKLRGRDASIAFFQLIRKNAGQKK